MRPRVLLALLVLLAFTLAVLDTRPGAGSPFAALRRGADAVLGPPERAVGHLVSGLTGAVTALPHLGSLATDNGRLERENAALRARLAGAADLRRRTAELTALLATRPVADYPVVPARVVALGPGAGFEWTATLDAGSRDGIRPGQTVLSAAGLVGRTKRVGPTTSTVVLMLDPLFSVGARSERLGGVGLVSGHGVQGLRYELLDPSVRLQAGDRLVTTGSDLFVPDVPVGTVRRIVPGESTLTRVAEVTPFVDLDRLDLVGIVVGRARTGTRKPLPP